jgi:hypothetical protein
MHSRKVAAHFAAFVWFLNRSPEAPEQAGKLATANWPAFLPLVDEGLVRLLRKVATPQAAPSQRRRLARPQSVSRRLGFVAKRAGHGLLETSFRNVKTVAARI